jgi:hypothetical protein
MDVTGDNVPDVMGGPMPPSPEVSRLRLCFATNFDQGLRNEVGSVQHQEPRLCWVISRQLGARHPAGFTLFIGIIADHGALHDLHRKALYRHLRNTSILIKRTRIPHRRAKPSMAYLPHISQ